MDSYTDDDVLSLKGLNSMLDSTEVSQKTEQKVSDDGNGIFLRDQNSASLFNANETEKTTSILPMDGEVRAFQVSLKKSISESHKLEKQLMVLEQKFDTEMKNKKKLEQKLSLSENAVSTHKKEILFLQRQLQSGKNDEKDRKLELALQEISSLQAQLAKRDGQGGLLEKDTISHLEKKVDRLMTEKNELLSCLRSQNKLIDVLKRQKLHLEAASLLEFSEKEFKMTCVTGDDTGLVKVWDISKSTGATLSYSFGDQSRKRGIAGMCWMDSTTSKIALSTNDGVVSLFNVDDKRLSKSTHIGVSAALPSGLSLTKGKFVLISKCGKMFITSPDFDESVSFECNSPVEAVHIHRKFGMVSIGGKDNDLCVYDIASQDVEKPVFIAKNVRDHVLDIPHPVYVTGACIINPFVFCTTTGYHQVRFYDRRSSEKPVQEYEMSREIERKPTVLMQWNCNKFLVGEASGDVHLYDTRRGFTSRAKLKGGVGSVRSMAKHPAGHQLLGVTGLDRKARLYHVPTGKLLMSMYTKQKATCILLDKNLPLADSTSSFSGITNNKQPDKTAILGEEVWDNMDPVIDDIIDDSILSENVPKKTKR